MIPTTASRRIICLLAVLLCCWHSTMALALTDDYTRQQSEQWQPTREELAKAEEAKKNGKYAEITWENLIPPTWDPAKVFDKFNFDKFSDDDPRADKALKEFQAMWSNAPANKTLGGKLGGIKAEVITVDDQFSPDAAKQAAGGLVFTWPANIDYVPTFAGIDHIVLDSGMLAGRVKSLKIDGSDHKALLATVQFDV